MFADIILPLNLPGTFTYKVPLDLQKSISTGMRVLVPFRGKKIYTGIVDSLHANKPQNFLAKDLISILDKEAILPKSQLDFWHWIADYYLGNLGEIYRYTFPSSLKLESETYLKLKPYATINLEILDSNELLIVQALEVKQLINLTEIEAFIPKKEIINTIHSLLDLQYIEVDEKVQEKYKAKEVKYIRLVENILQNNKLQDILLLLKNAPKQQQLFLTIVQNYTENPDTPLRKSTLLSDNLFTTSQLKALQNRNLVEEFILEEDRLHFYNGELDAIETLSPAQEKISKEIDTAFLKNQSVLLHGVTASGKTHLYLKQIENTIASHKSVLFLLPEIAITKQIANRLEKKYGSLLRFYHQKLSDFEKVEVWKKIKKGEIKIIIGTKEALFLPFDQLGLIIVDEEHDLAYRKKDFSPFFNAKDSALVLAKLYNCPCILGSATPSVESYYWAMKGKLKYLYLNVRYGNVSLPSFELINIKEEIEQKKMQGNFSNDLLLHLQNNFQEKKQALILHNRRGYSMVVECESCGYVQYCSNCDVVMTYHKSSNEMKCHYCGQKASKTTILS